MQMSIEPGRDPHRDRGRRQVEGDGLAGDEVVVAEEGRYVGHRAQAIRPGRAGTGRYGDRVDIDAFVTAHRRRGRGSSS